MIGVVPCISVPVNAAQQPIHETSELSNQSSFAQLNGSASEYHSPRNFSGMRRMDKSRSVSHLASPSVRNLQNRSTLAGTPTKSSDTMLGRVGSLIFNW